jgi:DNA-binding NarL/FixJ family response regulator
MIRVAIADDHAVIRKGLELFFKADADVKLVGEAENVDGLMKLLSKKEVDVLLLDIDMPGVNGLTALKSIVLEYPELKVIMLSMHPENIYGLSAKKYGARGYINKDENPMRIVAAVKEVYAGAEAFSDAVRGPASNRTASYLPVRLSQREVEVLKLLSQGKSNKDISEELEINEKTVSTYKQRLMTKTKAKTVVDLIHFASSHRLS